MTINHSATQVRRFKEVVRARVSAQLRSYERQVDPDAVGHSRSVFVEVNNIKGTDVGEDNASDRVSQPARSIVHVCIEWPSLDRLYRFTHTHNVDLHGGPLDAKHASAVVSYVAVRLKKVGYEPSDFVSVIPPTKHVPMSSPSRKVWL